SRRLLDTRGVLRRADSDLPKGRLTAQVAHDEVQVLGPSSTGRIPYPVTSRSRTARRQRRGGPGAGPACVHGRPPGCDLGFSVRGTTRDNGILSEEDKLPLTVPASDGRADSCYRTSRRDRVPDLRTAGACQGRPGPAVP